MRSKVLAIMWILTGLGIGLLNITLWSQISSRSNVGKLGHPGSIEPASLFMSSDMIHIIALAVYPALTIAILLAIVIRNYAALGLIAGIAFQAYLPLRPYLPAELSNIGWIAVCALVALLLAPVAHGGTQRFGRHDHKSHTPTTSKPSTPARSSAR